MAPNGNSPDISLARVARPSRDRSRSAAPLTVSRPGAWQTSCPPESSTHHADKIMIDEGSTANGPRAQANFTVVPAYSPEALLNPRAAFAATSMPNTLASRRPKTNGDDSGPISLDFQFPSPNIGTNSGQSTPPPFEYSFTDDAQSNGYASSHTSTPVNGFSSMIERANNIEQRTSAPQPKRRRVENGDTAEAVKTLSSMGGGSGMIGHYMKEKRDDAAKDLATQANLIEIVDDESDVVEVENVKDQEVCFGMIQGAKLNCHLVPSPKPGSRSLMANYWPQVKIVLNRKVDDATSLIQAKDHTRQIVGRVDSSTSSGLVPLLDSRLQLRTDCRIPTRPMGAGEIAGQEASLSLSLDLMLYGPRKSGRAVARHLSQKQLWLRNPPRVDAGIKYENPQNLEGQRPPPVLGAARGSAGTSSYSSSAMVRTVEEIRSDVMGVFDSLTKTEELPEMEPDGRIQTELLLHQKQGLYFMTSRESPRILSDNGTFWKIRIGNNGQKIFHNVITGASQREPPPDTLGGILADMMGLGKTLSILSLVTTSLDVAEEWSRLPPVQPQPPAPPKKNGASSRAFDVPAPEPLGLTRISRNARATLLICPLSTIANWEEQIKTHIKPGTFSYYIYHGSNRIKDAERLAQFDIVITTYGSVATEVAARHKRRGGQHPLEEINWFRVVLDEAHQIREQSTLQFKAICRLQANRRWAVTGTPVQNKLDDLAALLAFIRLKPFDEKSKFTQYIVAPFKVCDPEIVPKLRVLVDSVTLRRLKDRINLPPRTDHLVKLDFSQAEDKLYKLFERNAADKVQVLAQGRDRMIGGKTYIHILQSILRLRLISAHGRDLLTDEDLQLVQGMTEDSAIDLDDEDEEEAPAVAEARAYGAFELMQETNNDKCVYCSKQIGSSDRDSAAESERDENILCYMSSCFHLVCKDCKGSWINDCGGNATGHCPHCQQWTRLALTELRKDKADVEHDAQHASDKKAKCRNATSYGGPHTKTRALVEDLLDQKAKTDAHPDEPAYKSVVFSAWTSHLDLIELALKENGITFTRLDGKMSRVARSTAMDTFREDNSVHVMLVSIMAGGLGLNLTAGNNVYVMEPQYNPAAEAQAIDRVHRLGQKRPVRTVRYIMSNSIEEKMLQLQEKKTKLANLSMDRNRVMDKAEAAKQKLMDLRSLFK